MRSPYLVDFRNQLSELNNRLSHYIFVWEQFAFDNAELLSKRKSQQTTSVYPDNRYARQYNVKLGKLAESHNSTSEFILKSLYLLLYSEFEVYMRSLYELARKVDKDLPHIDVKARVPDKVFELLNIEMNTVFDQKEQWTFEYFRLRRNRIVHSGGQSKGELADVIKHHGNALQKYWDERLTRGLFGLNFQSEETNHFIKEEFFDFINIWRILTIKIDELICARMSREKFIKYVYAVFINDRKKKLKGWGVEKTKAKFLGYTKMEFDFQLTQEEQAQFDYNGDVA
ncbi:hypothetical protein [Pedobacter kyungheensis]|uniref:hypothetical protein n=1 Tax=Pedobacter kyungheensis TaxID=1069985 RepID=UPI0009E57861|nr:hypothetical protein [Pedobacter kyungheensis]